MKLVRLAWVLALVFAPALDGCIAEGGAGAPPPDFDSDAGARVGLPERILWLDGDEVVESEWILDSDGDGGEIVIVDGDLSLGAVDEALAAHRAIEEALASGEASVQKLAMDVRLRQWDEGVIRFELNGRLRAECDQMPPTQRCEVVRAAIAEWNALTHLTGIRWVERNLKPRHSGVLIKFNLEGGCSAGVGRHLRRNDLDLGPGCFWLDVVMHEMGHSMGLRHEHQR
ncbi:MAG: hypothetical protein H5U40_10655 [Polyangiaceae bacterium]|nr:hypothetical protein [Polyangiaceae bacterium]